MNKRIRYHIRKSISFCYFHKTFIVFETSLTEPIPEIVIDPRIEIRKARTQDLPKLKKLVPPDHGKQFERSLTRGDICTIALVDDEIVAYVWVTVQDYSDGMIHRTIHLDPDEGFGYDAYTVPHWRGRKIRTLLQAEERRRCQEMNRRRFKFLLSEDVVDSALRTWESAGLHQKPVARWDIFNILCFKKDRISAFQQ
jgi:GNAT superfamily N-acetyltransferase